ncbi:YoaK family protein [Chitinimonas sp. BJYL2]|uniref:YoaK family protein n=1 Tax=Chitinimonas sp. BJYL2 TaxID=2976696 RepID=UPI0022B32925|nr:YoaK family protein [Chitinimonas sp. BJYL2]
MPIQYLRQLSGPERNQQANRQLGFSLAFIAGAVNAGGFLAVGQYTSHMTGMVSMMVDHAVMASWLLAAGALVAVITFVAGAMTCALLVNWARRRALRSVYALSLLLEAVLLLVFGLMGAALAQRTELLMPATVLLLCYIMGLQNAMVTKLSQAEIRTTHLTGLLTDIGIELGRALYPNRPRQGHEPVRANRIRLALHAGLVTSFVFGAIVGALGFKHMGFVTTLPLAAWLTLLASLPVWDDLQQLRRNSGPQQKE